ncbi:hypothetical protein H4R19_004117 [Coemansia spiralis]|nr:hypothetical protein H4R19_004117 [Coemansia spiralis]
MSHSTRTNVSTLNASNESAVPHSPGSIDDDTMHEVQGARPDATSTAGSAMAATAATTTATAHAASAATLGLAVPAAAPANRMPLEIMELASELELALAREQEDYYSDNDPVLPTLDPAILQSLGRAVRQQCLLQRQQMQRRKSNMQLGLTHGGTEEAGGPDATLAEAALDDHEWPGMQAVLADVSQYFVQSGLNLVFPFSAKWVDWLTRHPDRPFPWRKDPEDDLALLRDDGQDDGDGGTGGGGDDGGPGAQSDASSFYGEPPALSRPLPPDDVLSIAMIPMSKRRPTRVSDFVTQEKRRGINAHWQYYSVINQITAVASSIHHKLQLPEAEADHTYVAHELAALYQFLGGDFKKYKAQIEHVFDTVKQGLGVQTPPGTMTGTVPVPVAGAGPVVLGAECAADLREMMASIIVDALYAMNKVAPSKEQPPPPNTPTGTARARQDQHHVGREPVSYAISTLKGLPTQPIIRYLAREMRVVHADHHHHHQQRRRRGLAHNLSRNSSANHLRHPQYTMYQAPPLPPLPHQPLPGADTPSHGRSDSGHDSGPLTISAAAPGLQSGSTT